MISVTEKDSNSINISLEGELNIYVANKFNLEMANYIEKYQQIDIDMSAVTELDTSCYQVLLRVKLLCMKNKKNFNIDNVSDQAQQIIDLYNLSNVIEHNDNVHH